MNDELILKIIKEGGRLYNKTINNNLELKNYLNNRYQDIPENIFSYKEVIYRIEHKIDIRPICPICGNPLMFIGDKPGKSKNGFRYTCSKECHYKNKESYEKYANTKKSRSPEEKLKEKYKREQTCIERYGERNVFIAKKNQIKDTMIKLYGGYTMQSKILSEKVKQTNLEKYGCENVFAAEEIKDKIKDTCISKYGTNNYIQCKEGRKKASIISKAVNEKRKLTNLKKYGSYYLLNNDKIQRKRLNTLKKNHTFNSSKIEQQFKKYLEQNYPNDFEYQYKSELYPFNCDFYIKSLDLYIEINGSWTHGGHPFNENNQDDINKLNEMKSKNSEYYQNAINTWTIRDVNKRNIAKENNLNYLEIFSKNPNVVIKTFEDTINKIYK